MAVFICGVIFEFSKMMRANPEPCCNNYSPERGITDDKNPWRCLIVQNDLKPVGYERTRISRIAGPDT